jgi:hypothetical protein
MVDTTHHPPLDNNNNNNGISKRDIRGTRSPAGKRSKREWLAFKGTKHSRVGNDFQVTALPSPNDDDTDKKDDHKPRNEYTKEEVTNDSKENKEEA